MNLPNTDAIDPFSKRVLLLDPGTPGINTLKWGQLADQMKSQDIASPRFDTHAVEYRVVPTALFSALFSDLMVRHGPAVALSCLHRSGAVQTLVYTKDDFRHVVSIFSNEVEKSVQSLNHQLSDMRELISYLHVLDCTDAEDSHGPDTDHRP